ncbi:FAD binding domain-containing protein [Fusarium redolens]|uniref:FAD binding domain-containing protein n=1 Tax=Fusarium redolens TaxID=48865 RepID=A0A9P9FXW7_FUSRE|nr:FAD binding domain-containing protein [Fusarium redolens]KAH7203167.1 FAD binding domain-containing protein [Fusarium redolens]
MPSLDQEMTCATGHHQAPNHQRTSVIKCDILIIGAGAAGLAAAAAAHDPGLRVILAEKEDHVGGTTFRSGGCMWMPNNFLMQETGIEDSKEQAAATPMLLEEQAFHGRLRDERLDAFLTQGPEMMRYSETKVPMDGQTVPVSRLSPAHRRCGPPWSHLDPAVFDAASLGHYQKYLPKPDGAPVIPRFEDFRVLTRLRSSGQCRAEVSALPKGMSRPVSMGRSLIAQLLKVCKEHDNVEIWTGWELSELLLSGHDGGVIGARVQRRGSEELVDIHASLGVILTTGGFSQNQEMRDAYLAGTATSEATSGMPTKAEWSLASDGDAGIALRAGQRIGAGSAQLGQVWGIPTMIDPRTGKVTEAMFAISKPFSIVVDGCGRRFFSESQPYGEAVRSMYERANEDVEAATFWLVFDRRYRRRYPIGSLKSTWQIDQAVEQGLLLRSDTIDGLAEQMHVPSRNLQTTVDEWNEMCDQGRDKYFHRGEDKYQQFIGDPTVVPNPCIGPVKESPFYGIRIFPGDAGTRGGPQTDQFARVLRADGSVISGLFAGGNASVALLGTQGAGTTLAPAMTEGFIAVKYMQHLARGSGVILEDR